MESLIVAFENDKQFKLDSTGQLIGTTAPVYVNRIKTQFPDFHPIWNGNLSYFGSCIQGVCTGIAQLIASGQADIYYRARGADNFDNGPSEVNISFSVPVKELVCSFTSVYHQQPQKYYLDALYSVKSFTTSVEILIAIGLLFSTIFLNLFNSKSQQIFRKFCSTKYKSQTHNHLSIYSSLKRIFRATITTALYSLSLIYFASFRTDLSTTAPLRSIERLSDLEKFKVTAGVFNLSPCYQYAKSIEPSNLINKLEPYGYGTKIRFVLEYYSKKMVSGFVSIFGDDRSLEVFRVSVCTSDRTFVTQKIVKKSSKKLYSRLAFYIYSKTMNQQKQAKLEARIYSLSENGLFKLLDQQFSNEIAKARLQVNPPFTCSIKTKPRPILNYWTLTFDNYQLFFLILMILLILCCFIKAIEIIWSYFNFKRTIRRKLTAVETFSLKLYQAIDCL